MNSVWPVSERISHLPGEPVKARLNPVQAFFATVRSLVLILNTFIVFHAANIGRQRRVRHGVFTLMRVLLIYLTADISCPFWQTGYSADANGV